jgi:hypothetical protein
LRFDLGAPRQLEALQGIGSDGPEEAPRLAQPVLQQQRLTVEQPALDFRGAPGPRLGQGGVGDVCSAGCQAVEEGARQRPFADLQSRGGPAGGGRLPVHLHQQVDQAVVGALPGGEELGAGGVARLAEAALLDRREGFLHEPAGAFEIAPAAQDRGLPLQDPGHLGRRVE